MNAKPRAPFPYYGSKLQAAPLIEKLMGPVNNLVIPFAGALGELLGRSVPAKVETVNDADGLVVNAWRAITYSPEATAELCDHPVHELTLHAAHDKLVERAHELPDMLRSDPKAHDVELAAWWIWGASAWLGSGWCRDVGHRKRPAIGGQGDRPHLGRGVVRPQTHRTRPQLSHAGHGVTPRQMPMVSGSYTGHAALGNGVHSGTHREHLIEWFRELAARLRWVRIICGDWRRVLTEAVTTSHGLTGVSLDPPYCHTLRSPRLYRVDGPQVSGESRLWAIEHGPDPLMRITLAGKGEEHDATLEHDWSKHVWRKDGETIWASPHCLALDEAGDGPLFAGCS